MLVVDYVKLNLINISKKKNAIKNGQSRDINSIEHKTRNEYRQNKNTIQKKK